MWEHNIKMLEDTLNICENGYFKRGLKKIKLKLSYDEMKQSMVFLPEDIKNLLYINNQENDVIESVCRFDCINMDSFALACQRSKENNTKGLLSNAEKTLVLNLANPVNIGGGVRKGATAQEEDLCRTSSLLISLESENAKRYYEYNRSLKTYMGSDAVLITPNVEIIKERKGDFLEESVIVSVMTCAAPCLIYGMEGLTDEKYKKMIYNRIDGMLRVAAHLGYKKLVLGAFGCGAFCNDARIVSDIFYKAIKNFDFDGAAINDIFKRIDFAVFSSDTRKYNFKEFYRNFGPNVFFWHEYEENGCFSNWYESPFEIDGQVYRHVEQYIMAQKAKLFCDKDMYYKILDEISPERCKQLGKKVRNFDEKVWEKERNNILLSGVRAKFSENEALKEMLLKTKDKIIAQASPADKIYGIGLDAETAFNVEVSKWQGKNLLGKALMQLRNEMLGI